MSTALTVQMDETELMQVLQSSLYPGAAMQSVKLVLGYCKAAGLDPMQKPCHIVPMWDKNTKSMRDVIMPGVGLYRTQAARTGEYAGMSEPEFGPDVVGSVGGVEITYPKWCKVVVKRQMSNGTLAEFPAIEFWLENYATAGKDSAAPNAMWKKRPYGQITKCAEAQALRKAFPEVGSAPTADEMEGKELDMGTAEVVETRAAAVVELPLYEHTKFLEMLPKWEALVVAGTKTAENIGATVATKHRLTDEQTHAIRNLGKKPEVALATPEQMTQISDAMDQWGIGSAEICKRFNLESLANLPAGLVEPILAFILDPTEGE